MKAYRTHIAIGLVLALLLGAAGLAGYGVVVYYSGPILFLFLLLLAAPTVRHQPPATAYLCAVGILVAFSLTGTFLGHWGRRLQCRSKCKACEPLLALLQRHRDEHGQFPSGLSEVPGFELARRDAGLDVAQGEFASHGIDLDGINSHDVLIYLDKNFVSCVVPVTKQLPMSFTRLYVYGWNSDAPSWKYDKVVWTLERKGER